jgi:polyisoprenoid-binding protein YceI
MIPIITKPILLVLVLCTTHVLAQNTQLQTIQQANITIQGTSTIHDWESVVEDVDIEASFSKQDGLWIGVEQLSVNMPVRSIESGKNLMNSKTYEALKAKDHPIITFQFKEMLALTETEIKVLGSLSIAGVTKEIELLANYILNDQEITISGLYPLNMRDFGIDPPTAMMGSIKTGELVDLSYDITFKSNQ